jgi:dihydroneopterin triphosphate diphosphatase
MVSADLPVYKIPLSVLVVIHTGDHQVLLIERADWPGFWQSVTGSVDSDDQGWAGTAIREVREETGIDASRFALSDWGIEKRFEIYSNRRKRYAPGTTHNSERVFGLLLPAPLPVTLAPAEHTRYEWLPWDEAAAKCFSWSNRDAILMLPERSPGAS